MKKKNNEILLNNSLREKKKIKTNWDGDEDLHETTLAEWTSGGSVKGLVEAGTTKGMPTGCRDGFPENPQTKWTLHIRYVQEIPRRATLRG